MFTYTRIYVTTFNHWQYRVDQLYSHLQVPVEDRNLPAHNAQVLRPQEDIPTDTIFNKQLEKFRAERSEKNRDKSMEQLYIP